MTSGLGLGRFPRLAALFFTVVGSSAVGCSMAVLLASMIPRRPILLGGLIGPVLWSGLLYLINELLDPLLAKYINWYWFIASQIAFGVVAGIVVMQQHRVPTDENIPFAIRAGIEAPGMLPLRKDED